MIHVLEALNAHVNEDEADMVDAPTKKPTTCAMVIAHKVSNQTRMYPIDEVVADCFLILIQNSFLAFGLTVLRIEASIRRR